MSGYLQRLASRAMGAANPLRTTAASRPWGPSMQPPEEEGPLEGPDARRRGWQSPMPPAAESIPDPAPWQQATVAGEGAVHAHASGAPAGNRRDEADSRSDATAGDVSPRYRNSLSADRTGTDEDTDTGSPQALEPHRERRMASTVSPPVVSPLLPEIEPERIDAQPGPQHLAAPARQAPSPLLPLRQPTPPDLALPSMRAGRLPEAVGRTEPASDEPTEVHVHIGRIEVTAVQETPAPKAAPRRRQPTMSLDDYLARRQGGRA